VLEVERVLSSYGRVKVLGIILSSGELNISEITRRSRLSHSSVARHLQALTISGLVTEKRFNRIRIFRVDYTNPFVATLNRFISDWNELSHQTGPQRSFA